MFPVLWRYLLKSYLKVFSLSVCSFVSILIVSRFKEIARFAALSGNWMKTGLFLLYQVPFILPLAIPISALVAAYLLFQRASRTYELHALRVSGISLHALLTPLLSISALLACINFSCSASMSPFCWRESKALLVKETSANPIVLMQRQNLVRLKYAYLNMNVKKEGKEAIDFILIAQNHDRKQLDCLSVKCLKIEKEQLFGYHAAWLSYLPEKGKHDLLFLENQATISSATAAFSSALKKNKSKLEPNALSLPMLRLRSCEIGKQSLRATTEILRRCSISLAVLTFTLLGCAFGLQSTRTPSKKAICFVFSFALLTLIAYLSLKTLKSKPLIAYTTAFLPHCLILFFSLRRLRFIAKGYL